MSSVGVTGSPTDLCRLLRPPSFDVPPNTPGTVSRHSADCSSSSSSGGGGGGGCGGGGCGGCGGGGGGRACMLYNGILGLRSCPGAVPL